MNTKIIIQRHGQSEANVLHIYAGHTDYELSPLGHEQARLGAEALAGERVDAIYSSDLKRAMQTAAPHAKLRSLTVNGRRELREIYLGDWEASERDYLIEKYPYEAVYIWQNFFGIFRAPNGESAPDAAERFYNEVCRIATRNFGKTVLITAHAAVIRLFWGKVCGVEPERVAREIPFPSNASFSVVEYDGERLIPISYSDDSHLSGAKSASLK